MPGCRPCGRGGARRDRHGERFCSPSRNQDSVLAPRVAGRQTHLRGRGCELLLKLGPEPDRKIQRGFEIVAAASNGAMAGIKQERIVLGNALGQLQDCVDEGVPANRRGAS